MRVKSRLVPKECEVYVAVGGKGECWLWVGGTSRNKKHRRPYFRSKPAYRYIYESIFGPLSKNEFLCHKCDNPMCVNPSHLFVGSQADNMKDAVAKGRPIGRPSKRHRLADQMIGMRKKGASMYRIAKSLGLDHSTIRWHLSKEA